MMGLHVIAYCSPNHVDTPARPCTVLSLIRRFFCLTAADVRVPHVLALRYYGRDTYAGAFTGTPGSRVSYISTVTAIQLVTKTSLRAVDMGDCLTGRCIPVRS